ncbi:hypothetical protein [Bacillus sp. FJAT-47783]|uniref:hypothetical protein n=1 Tax=Bacillus sp. FJAT-47783 TaxID=2922712 RepID=UPI001FABE2B6|nr:hypothetical protein [Bacillus sp. FJAT-47783]
MKFKKTLASLLLFGAVASAAVGVQAYSPDYSDSKFTFDFSAFDEDDYTNGRKKGSASSMYINNTSNLTLKIEPQVDSQYGDGTKYVRANYRGYFNAYPGARYEVYNFAHEKYWDGVQVRFHAHYDILWGSDTATVKWSPDYTPDGAQVIGL